MKLLAPLAIVAAAVFLYLVAQPLVQDMAQSDGENLGADLAPETPIADAELPPTDDQAQTPTIFESAIVAITPSTYMDGGATIDQAETNRKAFRDMIAFSEGVAPGADGYRTMFGGQLVDSLADHPRRYFPFRDKNGVLHTTSAAGRYQFLARTWDELAAKLQLPDFGPASQDAACDELIRQRGALADVDAGRVSDAVAKCARTWASLPGAGYAQPEQKLADLVAAYRAAGGTVEA